MEKRRLILTIFLGISIFLASSFLVTAIAIKELTNYGQNIFTFRLINIFILMLIFFITISLLNRNHKNNKKRKK